ncbi:MAG: GlsB/YeaQ/YmgE family stress response membrane protein [Caldilineaceae bacterium]
MSLLGFLILLLIAAVCGALGQALAGYSMGGCLISIVVGFVGAFLGMWIARQFGLPELFVLTIDGEPFPIVWSIVGSAILAAVVGLLMRPRVAY